MKPDTGYNLNDPSVEPVKGGVAAYGGKGVDALLNLIGKAESGVHGYNQIWGGKAPITDMTVDEVLGFQDKMKAAGSASTAAGRYQFLKGTLTGLKKELGLTGEEKMTPELQDGLAIHLMRRRGLDRYVGGELSQDQFVNRLAQEWAGLPTTAGQSYYAGDGLNKSNVPLESVMTVVTDLATSAYAELD